MTKKDLRHIIKETVQKILKESHDLSKLTAGIPSSGTELGDAWNKMVHHLSILMDEVESFNDSYAYVMHQKLKMKEKLATQTYLSQLNQVVQQLANLRGAIKTMSDIQRSDISEGHPHGRYAQQAGATPFETPQDY